MSLNTAELKTIETGLKVKGHKEKTCLILKNKSQKNEIGFKVIKGFFDTQYC